MVLLRLPYRGDAGGILGIVPLCLPDDGDAVDQDESGITADRKSAAGDYATTKFSILLYTGNRAVPEFLGFAICLSYLIFLLVYFREYEMKSKAEQYNELIRMQMNSFQAEMDNTRKSEKKMSILRHDTRHHMAVLRTLIQQGDCEKALEYQPDL